MDIDGPGRTLPDSDNANPAESSPNDVNVNNDERERERTTQEPLGRIDPDDAFSSRPLPRPGVSGVPALQIGGINSTADAVDDEVEHPPLPPPPPPPPPLPLTRRVQIPPGPDPRWLYIPRRRYVNIVKKLSLLSGLESDFGFGLTVKRDCRHLTSGMISCYDYECTSSECHSGCSEKHDLSRVCRWNLERTTNSYFDLERRTLDPTEAGRVKVHTRLILAEDLSPLVVDLIGGMFRMSPEFFEDHLSLSGYTGSDSEGERRPTWLLNTSIKMSFSMDWYRPALPEVPITEMLRKNIIDDQWPKIRVPSCDNQVHTVRTCSNILRRQWDLSSEPRRQISGQKVERPVGLEERITVWKKQLKNFRIIIILLDPLPRLRLDKQGGSEETTEYLKPLDSGPSLSKRTRLDKHHHEMTLLKWTVPRQRRLSLEELIEKHDLTTKTIHEAARRLKSPYSTLQDIELKLKNESSVSGVPDPLFIVVQIIYGDTVALVDVIQHTITTIREGSMRPDLLQLRVFHWRSLITRFEVELGGIRKRFSDFVRSAYVADSSATTTHEMHSQIPPNVQRLASDVDERIKETLDQLDEVSTALRAEVSMLDTKKSIAETEIVTKLTELAFFFIPLSFAASLFSMQVNELGDGVPVWYFVLTGCAVLLVAYSSRLAVRSALLTSRWSRAVDAARQSHGIADGEPVSTRDFLAWAAPKLWHSAVRPAVALLVALAPAAGMLSVFAALCGPLIALWARGFDAGFTAAISMVMLPLVIAMTWTAFGVVVPKNKLRSGLRAWWAMMLTERARRLEEKRLAVQEKSEEYEVEIYLR